jgi:hypothetical protein
MQIVPAYGAFGWVHIDPSPAACSDRHQTFPATHTSGTVKLWECLRKSRRVSRWTKRPL